MHAREAWAWSVQAVALSPFTLSKAQAGHAHPGLCEAFGSGHHSDEFQTLKQSVWWGTRRYREGRSPISPVDSPSHKRALAQSPASASGALDIGVHKLRLESSEDCQKRSTRLPRATPDKPKFGTWQVWATLTVYAVNASTRHPSPDLVANVGLSRSTAGREGTIVCMERAPG